MPRIDHSQMNRIEQKFSGGETMKGNVQKVWRWVGWFLLWMAMPNRATELPKMICYAVQPNAYLSDHAASIAKIYDGFFFSIGSWDSGPAQVLGVNGQPPRDSNWMKMAQKNLTALRNAGVTENFLTVYFGQDEEWPSPTTLLSADHTKKMADHFAAVAATARDLKFRGLCIDVEYPYPRYSIDHAVYTYEGYTVEDILKAAKNQGRMVMAAILDQFPEAAIIILPGEIQVRPICREFQLGYLEMMAERNAPGGMHLGTEFTYCMRDPITDILTARAQDVSLSSLISGKVLEYWKSTCTIAPGVWPLHMIETGSRDYVMRAWKDEIVDLREQLINLRSVSKKYIWTYSGNPSWYLYSPALEKKYGLKKQNLVQPDIDLKDWHRILQERITVTAGPMKKWVDYIKAYDRGEIGNEAFCNIFGTPGHWLVLGPLGNPRTKPQFAASTAFWEPINPGITWHGKKGLVRWFEYANMDPRGITGCRTVFDNRDTDDVACHFVSYIFSDSEQQGYLQYGWDDGLIVFWDKQQIIDESNYPVRGHGWLFQDRYAFEKRVPVTIKKGRSQLSLHSLNSHGGWMFSVRFTDADGYPLPGLHFDVK
jgi:hypothetical protein